MEDILKQYKDPYLNLDYITLGAVESLSSPGQSGEQKLTITLPYPIGRAKQRIEAELKEHLSKHNLANVQIEIKQKIASLNPRPQTKQLTGVRNIIAVASGKGGVGKSTTSIYLAATLQNLGARVGMLDADIYGPSQPYLLNVQADKKNIAGEGNTMNPVISNGIKTMSLSYLLDNEQTPAIWRGAMASNALQQLVYSTNWGDLDYLVVDMPPGTGDIQLTLCQRVSLSAAVIVTTPHKLALIGAEKAVEMFRKLYVPVLGMVENMSYYDCSKCGERHHIFGAGKSAALSKSKNLELLGTLPLQEDYSEAVQNNKIPEHWQDLAFRIALAMSKLNSAPSPQIQVVND